MNFPATVTRFAITESLSLVDMSGSPSSTSLSQAVFTFASNPLITGLSPASGHIGDSILINGRDFGPTQGSSTVTFNGTQATPASWSTCQIVAPVPSGATTGNVVVTVGGSTASGVNFTVLQPVLTTITVLPPNPIVSKGASQLFMALGTYSDSSTQDVSTSATWSSTNTGVATVDTAGVASATNAGQTTIQATVGSISGTTILSVTDAILTGSLNVARHGHTATLLNSGLVLVAGGNSTDLGALASSELYDPTTNMFSAGPNMSSVRSDHTATLLSNGKVLIVGGYDADGNVLAGAELYDPGTGAFTLAGNLNVARGSHTAALLSNGMVLIAGGLNRDFWSLANAELFIPDTGTFISVGSLNSERSDHTATLLGDGTVLIAGGWGNSSILTSAELFDPSTSRFTPTGHMNVGRGSHTATLLSNGKVLFVGGLDASFTALADAETYDATTGTFSASDDMTSARESHTATLLNNGLVLVAGGSDSSGSVFADVEAYDPSAGNFTAPSALDAFHFSHTSTLLRDGNVLIAGGLNSDFLSEPSAELYLPGLLTPQGLVSIAVSPSNVSMPAGATQNLTAIGTFSDSTTQPLASVTWSSSDTGLVTVTNDASNRGQAYAVAAGGASVSACAGTVCGSAVVTVNPLGLNITSVFPPSGAPGSVVAVSGTGFGASQGAGTITFSGVAAAVTSWSATGIVTVVPSGAVTGNVVVTISGANSNAVAFTILPSPAIASLVPNSGAVGSQVSINGSNFGAGRGWSVTFNGVAAPIISWGDANIDVLVPQGVATGNVVITTAAGLISNGMPFTLVEPLPPPTSLQIRPTDVNLLVGGTQRFTVVDEQGRLRPDAAWTVSDTSLATITAESSPTLTAVAVGQVTLTVEVQSVSTQAVVNILSGLTLPPGTPQWSLSLGGSGNVNLVPAVPSPGGADVFALNGAGTLSAISSEGAILWTVQGLSGGQIIPDFSGSAFVKVPHNYFDAQFRSHSTHKIKRVDPSSGQSTDLYVFSERQINSTTFSDSSLTQSVIPHPEGVVFVQDHDTVVVLNASTGAPIASVSLPKSTFNSTTLDPLLGRMIVAGDGNAYLPFHYYAEVKSFGSQPEFYTDSRTHSSNVLRVAPDGTHATTEAENWTFNETCSSWTPPGIDPASIIVSYQCTSNGPVLFPTNLSIITNEAAGAAVFVNSNFPSSQACASRQYAEYSQGQTIQTIDQKSGCGDAKVHTQLTHVSQDSVTAQLNDAAVFDNDTGRLEGFNAVLQREDGSFVGVDAPPGWGPRHLAAIGTSGLLWKTQVSPSLTELAPLFAISDGGIVVVSAPFDSPQQRTIYTVDQGGGVVSQAPDVGEAHSWKASYRVGQGPSIQAMEFSLPDLAPTYAAVRGGNLTGNGVAVAHRSIGLFWCRSTLNGSCVSSGNLDLGFTYAKGTNSWDFSDARPDWVGIVVAQGIGALKQAFAKYPVSVILGDQGSSGHTVLVTADQNINCGETQPFNDTYSRVYYPTLMKEAKFALSLDPDYPPPNQQANQDFQTLMHGIGRGIGRMAAHELGHQLSLPNMDCYVGVEGHPECEGGNQRVLEYNSCNGASDSAQHLYLVPPVSWGPSADQSLREKLLKRK